MITIRRAQMKEFGKSSMRGFEIRAVSHIETYFPEQFNALGERKVVEAVHYGIGRATSYRLATERDLLRYLTLMFTFGKDFDVDPALPWAAAILTSAENARTKTSRLQVKARNNRNQGKGYMPPPGPKGTEEKDVNHG